MAVRPPRWRPLLAAGAGLVVACLVFPPHGLPLYDGVGFPDEPYRYVTRPPGQVIVTQPPTPAAGTIPVVGGTTDGFNIASAEQGPQISVFVPTGLLRAPSGARNIVIRADPRPPDGPIDGARADGNVYRLTATSDAGAPSLARARDTVEVIMRSTTPRQPGPVMEYRPAGAGTWSRLPTSRYGTDVYAGAARGFGDYALVFGPPAPAKPGQASTSARGSGPPWKGLALAAAGLIGLLALAVVAVRMSRRGQPG